MCWVAPQSESTTARSGLTLAGAADGKPAIHRCVRYRTALFIALLSRGQLFQARMSGHFYQGTSTRLQGCGTARLRQTITCGLQAPVQASFLHQHVRTISVQHVGHSIMAGPGTLSRDTLSKILVHSYAAVRRAVRPIWNVSKWYRPMDLFYGPDKPFAI